MTRPGEKAIFFQYIDGARRREVDIARRSIHIMTKRKLVFCNRRVPERGALAS
jgi:hypothetical protein